MKSSRLRPVALIFALLALAVFPSLASANHAWNNYHWARTSNPLKIKVIDSMTSDWDDNLNAAIADWNASTVLDVAREAGDDSARTRKRCAAVAGKVRSCNDAYGNTGWLGIAQIWISNGHISQGTAKMNDTYLAVGYTETNRQHVICQEIGHDWGLGHQDESGADLNTCMDYADALDNPDPNRHDYDQLVAIYGGHTDSSTSAAPMPADVAKADLNAPAQWGKLVKGTPGRGVSVYVRDFGGGNKVITHVTWVK